MYDRDRSKEEKRADQISNARLPCGKRMVLALHEGDATMGRSFWRRALTVPQITVNEEAILSILPR